MRKIDIYFLISIIFFSFQALSAQPVDITEPIYLTKKEYAEVKQNFKLIDLTGVVNKGFKDEISDDSKGGWTDQGTNDFRTFTPRGEVEFLNIKFNIIDPDKNKGMSVLILRGKDHQAYPVKAEIPIKSKAKGIYFLHSSGWGKGEIGRYRIVYKDGTEHVIRLKMGQEIFNWWKEHYSDVARLAWIGPNLKTDKVGVYVYVWRNPLPNVLIEKIIPETDGDKAFLMLLAVTLTDNGPFLTQDEFVEFDTSQWIKYDEGLFDLIPGSSLDVSFLLDSPAGKHGFIKAKGDRFYFEKDREIRFWGMNLVASFNFIEKKKAKQVVERLAGMGVNIVRAHHLDAKWTYPNIFGNNELSTRKLDPVVLDKFDYLLSLLKKKGIYLYLDLLVSRTPKKNDGIESNRDIWAGFKIEGEFVPHLKKLQKEYIKQLLSHKNPYTGLTLAEDPFLVMVEIINEDSLFYIRQSGQFGINTPFYKNMWQKLFNKWLIDKYGGRKNLLKKWSSDSAKSVILEKDEDPEKGTVTIPYDYINTLKYNYSKTRIRDTYRFLYETQLSYYREMASYIRKLGAKCLIAGSNHWVADPADLYANAQLDFVDRHKYWEKKFGLNYTNKAWSSPFSMLGSKNGGFINNLSRSRVYGKPYVISEWNCFGPNDYRAEGQIVMALYSCLNNWNPIQFAYAHSRKVTKEMSNLLDVCNQPVMTALWPACSLIFHRKDIKEAQTGYFVELSENDTLDPFNQVKSYPELGMIAKTGFMFKEIATDKLYKNKKLLTRLQENDGKYRSVTGEIEWDTRQQLLKFESPRSLGMAGFSRKKPIKFKYVEFEIQTDFAIVILNSLSDKPIKSTKRLLLSTGSRVRQTGMKITERGFLKEGGELPMWIQPVEGKVKLKLNRQPKVYRLSLSGKRMGPVKVRKASGWYILDLKKENNCLHYEIAL